MKCEVKLGQPTSPRMGRNVRKEISPVDRGGAFPFVNQGVSFLALVELTTGAVFPRLGVRRPPASIHPFSRHLNARGNGMFNVQILPQPTRSQLRLGSGSTRVYSHGVLQPSRHQVSPFKGDGEPGKGTSVELEGSLMSVARDLSLRLRNAKGVAVLTQELPGPTFPVQGPALEQRVRRKRVGQGILLVRYPQDLQRRPGTIQCGDKPSRNRPTALQKS